MRNRDLKRADWMRWGHSSGNGTEASTRDFYVKRCRYCGERIYMRRDYDGQWRPYESYLDGKVSQGERSRLHDCTVESEHASRSSA